MADFVNFFYKTPEIFTLKASRYGNFCGGSCSQANVHLLHRQALQAHSRGLRRSQLCYKIPLSGKHNFPYTEIFPLRCRAYRKRLSLPFGIDDSIAASYLCQQKKAMKNGKHKTNSFNSSNSCSKKTYSLPFREGSGVGFFPSPSATHPQNRCSKCFKCFRCFGCFRCNYSAMQ